jgi:hypothetical protein
MAVLQTEKTKEQVRLSCSRSTIQIHKSTCRRSTTQTDSSGKAKCSRLVRTRYSSSFISSAPVSSSDEQSRTSRALAPTIYRGRHNRKNRMPIHGLRATPTTILAPRVSVVCLRLALQPSESGLCQDHKLELVHTRRGAQEHQVQVHAHYPFERMVFP